MRTISSLKFVGALAPPTKLPTPLVMFVVGAGKMPALSSAAAFGLIMQEGMMLPGNGEPCTMVAGLGLAPPGQLANKTLGAICVVLGTKRIVGFAVPDMADKLPP